MLITPQTTTKSLKALLWIIGLCAVLSPILSFILFHFFHLPGPSVWLALSLHGISRGYLWQLLSYGLIHSLGTDFLLSYLVSITVQLFLLWITGSELIDRFKTMAFWLFYLSATLICGAAALLVMFLSHSPIPLFGGSPALFALLTVWVMCYPDLELALFFVLRIKAKWLALIGMGFILLTHISYGGRLLLTAELAGILWGYLIGRWVWKLPHPFER